MSEMALATRPQMAVSDAMDVSEVLRQVSLIQEVMRAAMKPGEHYGTVPGCGDKPTLLQPGAQKLILTFRMNPDYDTEVIELGNGHREYRVKCKLSNSSGHFIGSAMGSCSTMESKYRYRVAPKKLTDRPVPKAYWDLKAKDPAGAQALLGGAGFSCRKNDAGQWVIAEGSNEKVEHDNPADYYNTCLKMAVKRALVAATLTRTAASDIFTQDLEEISENMRAAQGREPEPEPPTAHHAPPPPTQPRSASAQAPGATQARQTKLGDVTMAEAVLESSREKSGTSEKGKPWTLFIAKFRDDAEAVIELSTFTRELGEKLPALEGERCSISYKPGRKAGTFELMSIEPMAEATVGASAAEDDLPM